MNTTDDIFENDGIISVSCIQKYEIKSFPPYLLMHLPRTANFWLARIDIDTKQNWAESTNLVKTRLEIAITHTQWRIYA